MRRCIPIFGSKSNGVKRVEKINGWIAANKVSLTIMKVNLISLHQWLVDLFSVGYLTSTINTHSRQVINARFIRRFIIFQPNHYIADIFIPFIFIPGNRVDAADLLSIKCRPHNTNAIQLRQIVYHFKSFGENFKFKNCLKARNKLHYQYGPKVVLRICFHWFENAPF